VNSIRPKEYDQTIDIMDELSEGIQRMDPDKEELRTETNELCKKLLQRLIERGVFTEEKILNDLDFLNRCTMQIGHYSSGVTTKFAVQIGLYAKSIKNLGSKIHEESLRKAAMFKEMGCF